MRKIDLVQGVQILANIGVIAGIVFLAIELRQNTDMIKAVMNQSRAESAMVEAQSLYNSDFMPALLVKVRSSEALTADELERYLHYFRGFNRNMDNLLSQYRQGLLTSNIPRSIRFAVGEQISRSPVGRRLWEQTKSVYTDEYIALVDEVLAE